MIMSLRLCRVRQPNNCDFLSVHYGVPSRLHGDQKPSFSFEKVAKQTQILAHNQHDDGVSATDDVIPGPHRPLLKLFRVSWVPILGGFIIEAGRFPRLCTPLGLMRRFTSAGSAAMWSSGNFPEDQPDALGT